MNAHRDEIEQLHEINIMFQHVMKYFGLVGSVLMFAVYSRPSLSNLSLSIYYRCMALVCFLSCINSLLRFYCIKEILSASVFLAYLTLYVLDLFAPVSAWLEVLASLDRLITIVFPFKFKFIQKTRFQSIFIAIVILLNLLLYLHYLIGKKYLYVLAGIPENDEQGEVKIVEIIYLLDMINSSAIPFAIMLVTSVATFVGVWRAHRRIKFSHSTRNVAQQRLLRDLKFGVTIIILNVLFFICIGLNRLANLVNIIPFDRQTQIVGFYGFNYILTNIYEDYYLLHFYFHLSVNSIVRKELVAILSGLAKQITSLFRCQRVSNLN